MLLDYHGLLAVWTFAANRSVCNHSRLQNASCKIMRMIAVTPRSYFVLQILLGTEQLPAWTCPRKPIVAMLKSANHSANAVQAQCVSEFLRHFVTMKQSKLHTFVFCTCKTLSYGTFRHSEWYFVYCVCFGGSSRMTVAMDIYELNLESDYWAHVGTRLAA